MHKKKQVTKLQRSPVSVNIINVSYNKKQCYIWFKGGDLIGFKDIKHYINLGSVCGGRRGGVPGDPRLTITVVFCAVKETLVNE